MMKLFRILIICCFCFFAIATAQTINDLKDTTLKTQVLQLKQENQELKASLQKETAVNDNRDFIEDYTRIQINNLFEDRVKKYDNNIEFIYWLITAILAFLGIVGLFIKRGSDIKNKEITAAIVKEIEEVKVMKDKADKDLDKLKDEYEKEIESVKKEAKEAQESANTAKAHTLFQEGNQYLIKKEYSKGIEKYKEVIQIKNDFCEAYCNWGISLSNLSDLTTDKDEKEKLLKEGIEKYKKAIQIYNEYYEAYIGFGISLSKLSDVIIYEDEKDKLLKEGIEKYKKAIQIKYYSYEGYANLAVSLYKLAELKVNEIKKEQLLDEAILNGLKVRELSNKSYVLSFIFAFKKDKVNALKYLKESFEKKEVKVAFVLKEKEWSTYLNDQDFIVLLNKYE